MALSKIFKKTDAPDELPDLAIDELKKELNNVSSEKEEKKPEESPKNEREEKLPEALPEKKEEAPSETAPKEIEEQPSKPEEKLQEETGSETAPKEKTKEEKINLEKSFFNSFLTELKKEDFDPAKINSWYQKKFAERGAIEEMKEYWEKQKDDFITDTIEKEFKQRISEKMNNLQKLEAEWQEIYIKLVKKEEEMKKEEKNIKKIIKDFSQIMGKKGNVKKERKSK